MKKVLFVSLFILICSAAYSYSLYEIADLGESKKITLTAPKDFVKKKDVIIYRKRLRYKYKKIKKRKWLKRLKKDYRRNPRGENSYFLVKGKSKRTSTFIKYPSNKYILKDYPNYLVKIVYETASGTEKVVYLYVYPILWNRQVDFIKKKSLLNWKMFDYSKYAGSLR